MRRLRVLEARRSPGVLTSARLARVAHLLNLISALVIVGCASGGGVRTDEAPVRVRVQNNVIPPTSLTISLIPATGARRFIGVVAPTETKTLDPGPGVFVGPYRLLAEAMDGSALASRQFTVSRGATIDWNVNDIDVLTP